MQQEITDGGSVSAPTETSTSAPPSTGSGAPTGVTPAPYLLGGTQSGSVAEPTHFEPTPTATDAGSPSMGLGSGGNFYNQNPTSGPAQQSEQSFDPLKALFDLAAAQLAGGGGSIAGGTGGVVALPTNLDSGSGSSASAASNGKIIAVLIVLGAIGVYFYKRNKAAA